MIGLKIGAPRAKLGRLQVASVPLYLQFSGASSYLLASSKSPDHGPPSLLEREKRKGEKTKKYKNKDGSLKDGSKLQDEHKSDKWPKKVRPRAKPRSNLTQKEGKRKEEGKKNKKNEMGCQRIGMGEGDLCSPELVKGQGYP